MCSGANEPIVESHQSTDYLEEAGCHRLAGAEGSSTAVVVVAFVLLQADRWVRHSSRV